MHRMPGAPAVRWRARLGSGYSGVVVSGGRAVTMFSDGGNDVLAALDEASGKEVWRIPIAETHKGFNVIENALKPHVRTAAERPVRVYHDWGR
jgi:hypothetical protein